MARSRFGDGGRDRPGPARSGRRTGCRSSSCGRRRAGECRRTTGSCFDLREPLSRAAHRAGWPGYGRVPPRAPAAGSPATGSRARRPRTRPSTRTAGSTCRGRGRRRRTRCRRRARLDRCAEAAEQQQPDRARLRRRLQHRRSVDRDVADGRRRTAAPGTSSTPSRPWCTASTSRTTAVQQQRPGPRPASRSAAPPSPSERGRGVAGRAGEDRPDPTARRSGRAVSLAVPDARSPQVVASVRPAERADDHVAALVRAS